MILDGCSLQGQTGGVEFLRRSLDDMESYEQTCGISGYSVEVQSPLPPPRAAAAVWHEAVRFSAFSMNNCRKPRQPHGCRKTKYFSTRCRLNCLTRPSLIIEVGIVRGAQSERGRVASHRSDAFGRSSWPDNMFTLTTNAPCNRSMTGDIQQGLRRVHTTSRLNLSSWRMVDRLG